MIYALKVVGLTANTADNKDSRLALAERICCIRFLDLFPGSLIDISIIKISSFL